LSDTEIETMLRDSMQYAREDMQARRLREQLVEADRSIEALEAALAVDGDTLLTADERTRILAARDTLLALRQGSTNAQAIEDAIKALEKSAETYVERRMNASIRAAMAGHRVDEFKG
jgi:molecular chaperone HscA